MHRQGDLPTCQMLHTHGVDIELAVLKTGETALDTAAANGHLHVVRYLHALEVSLSEGWTGNELMFAAAKGQLDAVSL